MTFAGAVRTIAIAVLLASQTACGGSARLSPAESSTPSADPSPPPAVPAPPALETSVWRDTMPRMFAGAAAVKTPPRVLAINGFDRPESVLHDAEQDVYFVTSIAGGSTAKDDDGYISVITPDGTVRDTMWVAGGRDGVTLHAPKGMALRGDTLWVADIDALRGFHRRTGLPVGTIDLAAQGALFLNDVVAAGDGALYVTDTGITYDANGVGIPGPSRVFRVHGGGATVHVQDDRLKQPNGIAGMAANELRIASYGGTEILAANGSTLRSVASGPGRWDGIVLLSDGAMLVSSQATGTIYLFAPGQSKGVPLIRNVAGVGDIGWDAKRARVLVPLLGQNRVEAYEIVPASAR